MNDKYLFLDDIRFPSDCFKYSKQPMFIEKDWIIVRSYNEFVDWITKNGLPDFISFDHDLSDITVLSEINDQPGWIYKEKTGYDCSLWLIDYCIDNDLKCPNFYSHSMNPIGKEKINSLLSNFSKY